MTATPSDPVISLTSALSLLPFNFSYDWAALEGINVKSGVLAGSPASVPQPELGMAASDAQLQAQNPSISNHFKPIQSQQADCFQNPTTPVSPNGPVNLEEFETISEISVSKHFKASQTSDIATSAQPAPHSNTPNQVARSGESETSREVGVSKHFKPNQTDVAPEPEPSRVCGSPFPCGNNPKKRRRTGKVAQLPHATREQINILLDDGQTYREIVHWLESHGHPGFNQENISNWAQGGFQDWLNHRDKLDQAKILAQYARELVEQCPGTTFQEASQALIEMNFFDLLNRFDLEPLHKLLQEKPELYFRLMNSMTAFNRGKLAKDKFQWQQAQATMRLRRVTSRDSGIVLTELSWLCFDRVAP